MLTANEKTGWRKWLGISKKQKKKAYKECGRRPFVSYLFYINARIEPVPNQSSS